MDKLQLISRAIVAHNRKILLLKKIGADFWHYPGGKWEFEKESLTECARREVMEETDYNVLIGDLIWTQEIRKPGKVYVEFFWQAKLAPHNTQKINEMVKVDKTEEEMESIRWFTIKELKTIRVLPKILKY